MGAKRRFTLDQLSDPWVRFYELAPPSGGPIPFPAARNEREVERAARAIISGRSPGVEGWLTKRITELAQLRVDKDDAKRDVEELRAAIEARVVRIRLMEVAYAE